MCLAATADNAFMSLKGSHDGVPSDFHYLQDISKYSDFCRLVVMQWFISEKSDISALRCKHTSCESGADQASSPNVAVNKACSKDNSCSTAPYCSKYEGHPLGSTETCTQGNTCVGNVSNIPFSFLHNLNDSDILSLGNSFIEECSLDTSRKCTYAHQHYHCTLCPPWKHFQSLYKINRHIRQTHMNPCRTFDYGGFRLLPCKQQHTDFKYSDARYHYHCPICNKSVLQKTCFEQHMTVHSSKRNSVKMPCSVDKNTKDDMITKDNETPEGSNGRIVHDKIQGKAPTDLEMDEDLSEKDSSMKEVKDDEHMTVTDLSDNLIMNQTITLKRSAKPSGSCSKCGKTMLRKNLKRHSVNAYNSMIIMAVCCDLERGLYMVRKNPKGGIGYPVHVQKVLHSSDKTSVDCGDAKCKLEMQLAGRAKMTGRECRHLLQINNASYPETVSLHDNTINELGQDNQFRSLNNETISKCIALNQEAVREHARTVVQWQDGPCIHMSVYDSSVQSRPLK